MVKTKKVKYYFTIQMTYINNNQLRLTIVAINECCMAQCPACADLASAGNTRP